MMQPTHTDSSLPRSPAFEGFTDTIDTTAVPPPVVRFATKPKARALISRVTDFWVLGGLSIAVWALLRFAEAFKGMNFTVDHHFSNIPALFGALSLVVNYPHFMISYKFAYQRGPSFVKKHPGPLLIIPALLIGLLVLAYAQIALPIDPSRAFVKAVNETSAFLSLSYAIGGIGTAGKELFGALLLAMYFSVGWHYAKQVFGCLMVYSRLDRYPISSKGRFWLKANLFSLWALNFLKVQTAFSTTPMSYQGEFYGFSTPFLGLHPFFYWLASAAAVTTLIFAVNELIVRNWKQGQKPSLNFLVPWIAFFIWWAPIFDQSEYVIYSGGGVGGYVYLYLNGSAHGYKLTFY